MRKCGGPHTHEKRTKRVNVAERNIYTHIYIYIYRYIYIYIYVYVYRFGLGPARAEKTL